MIAPAAASTIPYVLHPNLNKPTSESRYVIFTLKAANIPADAKAAIYLYTSGGYAGWELPIHVGEDVYVVDTTLAPVDNGSAMNGTVFDGARIGLASRVGGVYQGATLALDWIAMTSDLNYVPSTTNMTHSAVQNAWLLAN